MNPAHLHLMVNHLPVFAAAFALALLLWALLRPSDTLRRTALVLMVVAGLGGVASDRTGEDAEHFLENQPGFSETYLEPHEEAAEAALIASIAAGCLAVGILVLSRGKSVGRGSTLLATVAALVVVAAMARTAWLGGKIAHPELRDGVAAVAAPGGGEHDD
jgi:uncharacterized membrane protein